MKSNYFCAFHTRNIQTNETEAMGSWISLMRRGSKAFSECRVDASRLYFEASLDIALLRMEQPSNYFFTLLQILKPTDFLMDIYMADESFTEAYATLNKISDQLADCSIHSDKTPQEILKPYYHGLAGLEKELCAIASKDTFQPMGKLINGERGRKETIKSRLFNALNTQQAEAVVMH